ncbi:MAG TPA: hypothetical protein PLJ35_21525 [Anaerolineae bacterium]|nr:hypothetical protein [Anaerolineae bacterium]HOR01402.1 hypothetical protein [Anaerolineae bacterium]HPL29024.1 hypothetical protein [Anaerolineae bacterium]
MGLDVYVGALTRYYGGDWRTAAQRLDGTRGPAAGLEALDGDTRMAVLTWRDGLSLGLQAHLEDPLDWDESDAAPCVIGTLGWEGYAGLLLWAAYAEHPELARPVEAVAEWEADPAYQASNAAGFASRCGHLLYGPELWLPCPFCFTFRAEDVCGDEVAIGSSPALLAELQGLNAATWAADAATLKEWRATPPPGKATLEDWARYGCAVLLELAGRSVAHGLPMKLDC